MMPTKFSIIIDVLMVYIFMRRGLYSSQHKNIHPSASHYYGLFVFGKRAMQNSRNITRLSLPPLNAAAAACHFQFSLLRPNFPSPIKLLRNNKTNPSNNSAQRAKKFSTHAL
jgi:nicotinamide riboside transporter PnuC